LRPRMAAEINLAAADLVRAREMGCTPGRAGRLGPHRPVAPIPLTIPWHRQTSSRGRTRAPIIA
jgi:hypothetical protein